MTINHDQYLGKTCVHLQGSLHLLQVHQPGEDQAQSEKPCVSYL